MYRVFQSPHIADIANVLNEVLSDNKHSDPFVPAEIIVANRDTARWLFLYLAEMNHIAGNIHFRLPSEWLWNRIREQIPDLPNLMPSDMAPMAWSLFSILSDETVMSDLPELKIWMEKQGNDTQLQLWQLSLQISAVFDQYQVYRPGMVNRWEQNHTGATVGNSEDPVWQPVLWRLLNKYWKSMQCNELPVNRARLFQMLKTRNEEKRINMPPVYLFNTGTLPPPMIQLLQSVGLSGEVCDFRVISTVRHAPGKIRTKNGLLESLGAEQLIRSELTEEFRKSSPEKVSIQTFAGRAAGSHNLGRIQASVIENSPLPSLASEDGSVVINSCHSPMREVEVLHQFLVGLFSDQRNLSPDDILVVTPDLESYEPAIRGVFGAVEAGMPEIPFHIAGGGRRSVQEIDRAFAHLLRLSDSRYRKEDLFDFLQNTAIRQRFQLSVSDISLLMRWFRENRVVWGLDGAHRTGFGQPEEDLQTWKHALRRGWLGQLVTDESGVFIEDMLLYPGVTTSDQKELWARVQEMFDMFEGIVSGTAENRSAKEWEIELNRWIDLFMPRSPSMEKELQSLRAVVRESVHMAETGGYSGVISFPLIRSLIIENLEKPRGGGSTRFTRGVIFNSMVPVRSLPFRVIALLGLNDDTFPRKPVHPEFDLMAKDPRPGERDRKSEDRNLFLESIMAAKEIHYCSYVGRNQKDDEPVPPSPVLDEWIQMVSNSLKTDSSCLVRSQSLNGFSAEQFLYESGNSFSSRYLNLVTQSGNRDGNRGLDVDRPLPPDSDLLKEVLKLDDIENFFTSPVGSFFRKRLGVYVKDPAGRESEEFEMDGLESHILFRHIFEWKLNGVEEETIKHLLIHSGHLPAGWAGEQKLHAMIDSARRAGYEIAERGFLPDPTSINIYSKLGNKRLEGIIYSYSKKNMLDLNPSGISGKRLLACWIRHLVLCLKMVPNKTVSAEEMQSDFYLDFRKGKGTWIQFRYEPSAEMILKELLDVYLEGMTKPVNLYVNSAYKYAVKLHRGEKQALGQALNEWGGDFNPYPERADRYLELILGRDAEADQKQLKEVAHKLFTPMIENMVELK